MGLLGLLLVAAASGQAEDLAGRLIHGETPIERREAAARLSELVRAGEPEVTEAVLAAVGWVDLVDPGFEGSEGLLPRLGLGDEPRRRIATELVTWRVGLTLVGTRPIPARLEAELDALLRPELDRYGAPTQTTDWLHLLAAAGADPGAVLRRLRIDTDHRWTVILDEVALLDGGARPMLPLLAHRSPIVRERAAERLERDPTAATAVLSRAWRWAPGRSAPLRGEIASPSLPRTEVTAERWADRLVKWARRSSRQRDDSALLATLCLLTEPSTTRALTDTARLRTADGLLKVARRDEGGVERVTVLIQAMDAVLRKVPLSEGERPAPEEVQAGRETWVRAVAPY